MTTSSSTDGAVRAHLPAAPDPRESRGAPGPDGWPQGPVDVRLVVTDMDGTLLDGDGRVPDGLWPLLDRLRERGAVLVPASGRQLATLERTFGDAAPSMAFVAENGTLVVRAGEVVSTTPLDRPAVEAVVARVRALHAGDGGAPGLDVGAVVCGRRSAYVERRDRAFVDEAARYYARLEVVDDVLAPDDDVLKVAVFDFGDASVALAPGLASFRATHQVVVSGEHWVDVMDRAADKGVAVRHLQAAMDVTPAQTVVFGDYLNDLGMLDAGALSFAVRNAHPDVLARARWTAPANTEHGVLQVLEHLLATPPPAVV